MGSLVALGPSDLGTISLQIGTLKNSTISYFGNLVAYYPDLEVIDLSNSQRWFQISAFDISRPSDWLANQISGYIEIVKSACFGSIGSSWFWKLASTRSFG